MATGLEEKKDALIYAAEDAMTNVVKMNITRLNNEIRAVKRLFIEAEDEDELKSFHDHAKSLENEVNDWIDIKSDLVKQLRTARRR
jgi:hypothetical protein